MRQGAADGPGHGSGDFCCAEASFVRIGCDEDAAGRFKGHLYELLLRKDRDFNFFDYLSCNKPVLP
jgi:hypothetical protein